MRPPHSPRRKVSRDWISRLARPPSDTCLRGTSAVPLILTVIADILNRQLRAQSASIRILARKKARAPSQRIHTSNPCIRA